MSNCKCVVYKYIFNMCICTKQFLKKRNITKTTKQAEGSNGSICFKQTRVIQTNFRILNVLVCVSFTQWKKLTHSVTLATDVEHLQSGVFCLTKALPGGWSQDVYSKIKTCVTGF